MAISKKKLALVHVAKNKLQLTDEQYRRLLEVIGGVETAKDLSTATFSELMAAFKVLGFESSAAGATYGAGRVGMATPAQLLAICAHWQAWAGSYCERELSAWLQHFFVCSHPRFLTHDAAGKALTALKKMSERRARQRA